MTTALLPIGTSYPDVFEDFRHEFDHMLKRFLGADRATGSDSYSPLCNVAETDSAYDISIDLPGVILEDVDVELRHGELWITGDRKFDTHEDWKWHRLECPAGSFQRVVRLSGEVDSDKIDAEFRNGILHVTVPKAESAKPKRIDIRG